MIATEIGWNRAGSIWLFTNGAPSVRAVPPRQAADMMRRKSPLQHFRASARSTSLFSGTMWFLVIWMPPKKNSLSFMIGPPNVPPN